jgi:hypothetical protein
MKASGIRTTDPPFRGVDAKPEDRPGVPREVPPHPLPGVHWTEPPQQPASGPVETRAELLCPTPVFSTAVPAEGMAGALRRKAQGIPDHHIRHWALLILADKIEAIKGRLS